MELILVTQNGCNPCTMVKNLLNSEEVDFYIANISVDESFADKYNVMSTPVTILFEDGEEIARVAGFKPEELEILIEQM